MAKKTKNKSIWLRLLLWIGGFFLFVVLVMNPLLKNLLAYRIKDKLVGNFYYSYDNLKVDLFTRSVTFENAVWKFPKDTTIFNHEGHIRRVRITGISLLPLIKGSRFRIHEISLDSLESITLFETLVKGDSIVEKRKGTNPFNYYDLIKGQMRRLEVDKIKIIDASATWLNPEANKVWGGIENMQFEIQDIAIDSAIAANNNGWFSFQNATLEGSNGEFYLADSLHKIILKHFKIDHTRKSITLDSLAIVPLFTKSEMITAKYFEKDRLEMTTNHVTAAGVDIKKLMFENKLRTEHILIDHPNLVAFRDKNAHKPPFRHKTLPQIRMKNLNLNIKIDSVTITDGYIRYEELSDLTQKKGEVFFNKINANFYNITNDSLSYLENPHSTIHLSTRLMDKGSLVADFTFNLLSANGDHWISGKLGQFELREFNAVLAPLSAVSIQQGHINNLEFDIRLNNDGADGKIIFLYSDLKIDMLDKDHLMNKEFDKVVKSLLANTFILKKSNPSENRDPRIGIIHYKRAKNQTIFIFWWKAIFDGMKSTVL